ncbi:hypothetical protein [Wenjunlia tyrosinilytica]|uniref:Membrane protein n=1 Tax=Wenjunlia tyrosinilytica TaxID=1544741 RepID=A0A917ZYR6_9ACTN|nr:hypothetical protein [Wenjunlia tyrosinilytica]GGP00831.1 membrane protein [Wenjunlia tyrosinilytica]
MGSDHNPKGTPDAEPGDNGRTSADDTGVPHDGPTATRTRRPSLVAVAVSTAVLLAGGGGAYLAAAAANDSHGRNGSASAGQKVAPLALDRYRTGGLDSNDGQIAPGEPDPNGSGPKFVVKGELPDGPKKAKVQRPSSKALTREDVAALAKSLGMVGAPKHQDGQWLVGGAQDGVGPTLRVNPKAPGQWTYSTGGENSSSDGCASAPEDGGNKPGRGKACTTEPRSHGGSAPDDGGKPISESEAKAKAAPLLKSLGLGDAALNATQTMGALRIVTAEPTVDGLPTFGWSTTLQIGKDGVRSGNGSLSKLVPGAEYPVINAKRAVRLLQNNPGATVSDGSAVMPCVPQQPEGPKASARPVLPAEPERNKPSEPRHSRPMEPPLVGCQAPKRSEPTPQEIRKAEFGLSTQSVGGRTALVPSWLFTVASQGSKDTYVAAQVAVDPKYIAKPKPVTPSPHKPGKPVPDEKMNVESYTVDGSTLTLTFWGGVCSDFSATAKESKGEVRVSVIGKWNRKADVCIDLAKEYKEKVTLDKPLGGRKVVDASDGERVSMPRK